MRKGLRVPDGFCKLNRPHVRVSYRLGVDSEGRDWQNAFRRGPLLMVSEHVETKRVMRRLYTVAETAERLGLSEVAVMARIRRGKLGAVRAGLVWSAWGRREFVWLANADQVDVEVERQAVCQTWAEAEDVEELRAGLESDSFSPILRQALLVALPATPRQRHWVGLLRDAAAAGVNPACTTAARASKDSTYALCDFKTRSDESKTVAFGPG